MQIKNTKSIHALEINREETGVSLQNQKVSEN